MRPTHSAPRGNSRTQARSLLPSRAPSATGTRFMLGAAPRFASFAYSGFASKGLGHGAGPSFSPALLLLTVLAFSPGALFVTAAAAAADSCSSIRGGTRVAPGANPDQSQPPAQCSVKGVTESECDDLPGHKHFEKDSGSGFTECFFDPPISSERPS